ncbi:hypothetical protein ACIRSS_39440 [Amycolatopsis sp. NPDC101161]|uniref:hypothetical protein n=1 Tax=Amycolatopsis sp. NPDC101161 TaxID=3363940 RepID=UPI0037F75E3C
MRRDPEQLIVLLAAATVAVLGATDTVNDTKTLLAATLATLAVLGFSIFKQAMRQEGSDQNIIELAQLTVAAKNVVDGIETNLTRDSSVLLLATPADKQKTFDKAMASTNMWQFEGGTGSFTRSWTLPTLAARARETSTGAHWRVQLQILDPRNTTCCQRYAEYRAKLSRRHGSPADTVWTTEYVQISCLATIFAAHWHQQHEFLVVEIRLKPDFRMFRYDISSDWVIQTNEDVQFPAAGFPRRENKLTFYYAYRADFDLRFESIDPTLKPKTDVRVPADKDDVTEDDVFRVLRDVGIAEQTLEGLPLNAIRKLAFSTKSSYH